MNIFTFKNDASMDIYCYKWEAENPKGIVQIAHGMAERAERYDRVAKKLNRQGYTVYANDHRGHGRSAGSPENKGQIGRDGFMGMLRDMKVLNNRIREENPGLSVFLLGHSMGSFLTQGYIAYHGDTLKGAILSGTSGRQGIMVILGIAVAWIEVKFKGFEDRSPLMTKLTFDGYNKKFEPHRTNFDWLSRDERSVDAYIADPFCGGVFPSGFYLEMLKGLRVLQSNETMDRIPRELPVYIFSGEKDPVGANCKTVRELIEDYRGLGIDDIEYKFYKDGRHEMLNDINRDEVEGDLIEWLERHL